ncbi:flavodoxin [Veillonella ratti]|uniref:flavodoxin n=1 Tax=Veillonella ratti TaxID=103892 RepID=UPI000F8F0FA8|nr:flavodoxin [Veillonella ratti]
MKALIIYYSYRGNTKHITDIISKETGFDTLRIDTNTPYTGSYNQVVAQGNDEVKAGYCPELKPITVNLDQYDTIILGTPVWWYTFAPAMHTFLKNHNFTGKTIYPFATNGGWLGHTFEDIKDSCQGADVKNGLNVRFDEFTLRTSTKEIQSWIQKIK